MKFLAFVLVTGFTLHYCLAEDPNRSTMSVAPSEAALRIEVGRLEVELKNQLKQFGPRHPNAANARERLVLANNSLSEMIERNRRENPSVNFDKESMIKLQQSVMSLSERVLKLEDEVRKLNVKLSDANN